MIDDLMGTGMNKEMKKVTGDRAGWTGAVKSTEQQ